jgi:hypothetical protein
MNYIDQIVQNSRAAYAESRTKWLPGVFGEEERLVSDAVEAYRGSINEDRFQRELLESDYWCQCNVAKSFRAVRSVVLQIAKKIDL